MNYEETRKAYRQIEEWRKEISEKENKHINNISDKYILLDLARNQVKKFNISGVGVPVGVQLKENKPLDYGHWKLSKGYERFENPVLKNGYHHIEVRQVLKEYDDYVDAFN